MSDSIDTSAILKSQDCKTFSNTSLIVIFLIILSVLGLIYYFYKNMTSKIDDKIDSVIKDINKILEKPITEMNLDDFNNLNKKNYELLTLINTGKALFPQYFSGYENILNMKTTIPSTFYFETAVETQLKDLQTLRLENINNILEKYKLVEKNIKDKISNLQNENKTLSEYKNIMEIENKKSQDEYKKIENEFKKSQDEYKKIENEFKDLSKDKKELFNKLNDAEKILNKSVLISNTIINDPRKKLIFELINNNISILLNFIKDKICPSFINPIFQDEKNRFSKQIDEFNNNIQLRNEEKRRLENELNKMTSNIILYFIMLSKSNNINIPSTFYVENLAIGGGGFGGGSLPIGGDGFGGGSLPIGGDGFGTIGRDGLPIGGGSVYSPVGGAGIGVGGFGTVGVGGLPIGGGSVYSPVGGAGIGVGGFGTVGVGGLPIGGGSVYSPELLELQSSPLKNEIKQNEQIEIYNYMNNISLDISNYLLNLKNIDEIVINNLQYNIKKLKIDCPDIKFPDVGIKLKIINTNTLTDSDMNYLTDTIFNFGKDIIKILMNSQSGIGSTPQGSKILAEMSNMLMKENIKYQIQKFINDIYVKKSDNTAIITYESPYEFIINNQNCNLNENTYIRLFSYNILSRVISELFKFLYEQYSSITDVYINEPKSIQKSENYQTNDEYDVNMEQNAQQYGVKQQYNNSLGFGSLLQQMNIDFDNIILENKELTNQITSIMLFYIDKILPGAKFDIDFGWKLPSNYTINKRNTLKIMEHYYDMLCGNQNKLKLYSNTLTNLLIDITDIDFS